MIQKVRLHWFACMLFFVCVFFFICGNTFAKHKPIPLQAMSYTSIILPPSIDSQSPTKQIEMQPAEATSETQEGKTKNRAGIEDSATITSQSSEDTLSPAKKEKAQTEGTHTESSEVKEKQWYNNWEALSAISTFVATLLALVLALFGWKINNLIHGAKLGIELISIKEEDFVPDDYDAIYCHLKCLNLRHRSPAKNVRVVLTDVFQKNSHGILVSQFLRANGPIPLHVQYENLNKDHYPPSPTITTCRIFDLARIQKDGEGNKNYELELQTHVKLEQTTFGFDGDGRIIAKVRAESDETTSDEINIAIRWNGKWPHKTVDIPKYLQFKVISGEQLDKELNEKS